MRKSVLLLVSMALAVLLASGVAFAMPSETPDETPMLNGPVRTIAQVGTNIWVGGNFNQVLTRDGTKVADVSNVAVFDSTTGAYLDIAPKLGAGSTTTNVRDIAVYGNTNNVVIGGDFPGPTTNQRNLVVVDGITGITGGSQPRWFNSPNLAAVLTAPDLGRIYGGGVSLTAFDFQSPKPLWTRAKTTVDPLIHSHNLQAGYRDLERDGSTIWAACGCDTVAALDGTPNPVKALVKLDTEGNLDTSWVTEAGSGAFGISVTQTSDNLYLAAGGSDYLAEHPKASNGARSWVRDTSGSAQVVEIMDGYLVVGGHFWEVADQPGDNCGARSSKNAITLDPNDECQTRHGLAIYSFRGDLEPNWDPMLEEKYNLAWALLPEATPQGTRLHVGGEFLTVNGVNQNYYARLAPNDAQTPQFCTITGTSTSETLTGTPGDDIICGGAGNDTLRGLEGNDILKGEGGADTLFGGAGDDTLDGGNGTDTASFSDAPAIDASLTNNAAVGEGYDVLSGVENLTGSNGNDTLSGSQANNTLSGGSGADTVVGMGGADKLIGATGTDALDSRDGVEGNDTLDGGADIDTCTTDATEKSITKCER
jgi:Ca2+-binding RTX toxin-like protein